MQSHTLKCRKWWAQHCGEWIKLSVCELAFAAQKIVCVCVVLLTPFIYLSHTDRPLSETWWYAALLRWWTRRRGTSARAGRTFSPCFTWQPRIRTRASWNSPSRPLDTSSVSSQHKGDGTWLCQDHEVFENCLYLSIFVMCDYYSTEKRTTDLFMPNASFEVSLFMEVYFCSFHEHSCQNSVERGPLLSMGNCFCESDYAKPPGNLDTAK